MFRVLRWVEFLSPVFNTNVGLNSSFYIIYYYVFNYYYTILIYYYYYYITLDTFVYCLVLLNSFLFNIVFFDLVSIELAVLSVLGPIIIIIIFFFPPFERRKR